MSLQRARFAHAFRCWLLLTLELTCVAFSHAQKKSEVTFKQDLQSLGYKFRSEKNDKVEWVSTDLVFLSEDLLLVSIKEVPGETPLSNLLLFSVSQKKLLRSTSLPIRKMDGSVVAGPNGSFFLLTIWGLHSCSADLVCGAPWPTEGPVLVSPRRTRVIAGGYRFSAQTLLDADAFLRAYAHAPQDSKHLGLNLELVGPHIAWVAPKVSVLAIFKGSRKEDLRAIPGDVGVMVEKFPHTVVQMPGQQEVDLGFTGVEVGTSGSSVARFLDRDKVIGIKERKAVVAKVDGTKLYEIPVSKWDVRFIPSASGLRFCVHELKYTGLTAIVDFGDESGAYTQSRVRVFDLASGRQFFELKWNPWPYRGWDIDPALSPSGHRLALVRKGELLVYELP
jgi:hypothetical protein